MWFFHCELKNPRVGKNCTDFWTTYPKNLNSSRPVQAGGNNTVVGGAWSEDDRREESTPEGATRNKSFLSHFSCPDRESERTCSQKLETAAHQGRPRGLMFIAWLGCSDYQAWLMTTYIISLWLTVLFQEDNDSIYPPLNPALSQSLNVITSLRASTSFQLNKYWYSFAGSLTYPWFADSPTSPLLSPWA